MDQYLYYETDQIEQVYFVNDGIAGYCLPFKNSIVYITILKGDFFGEIDFIFPAQQKKMTISEMFQRLNEQSFTYNMVRHFTVKALQDCNLLTLSIPNLVRMQR